jgi:hypothetical protein
MEVLSFDGVVERLSETSHPGYLERYLEAIRCRCAVVEDEYVDKGYLIDYCRYHARSFSAPARFTKRFHFFSKEFSNEDLSTVLTSGNHQQIQNLQDSYLGFVVVKPVKTYGGKRLIGRTVLTTYPLEADGERRRLITVKQSASLYGIPLEIVSLPYQTQDVAVGACATASLWVSMYPLRELAALPDLSLAEITEKSTEFPGEQRRFPSGGLNVWQMIDFIHYLGLDVEVVNPVPAIPSMIEDIVIAYTECNLPVIVAIQLKREDRVDHHAVVVSGYRSRDNRITVLYVHDDQIGPYSRVLPEGDFFKWKNEWTDDNGYDEVRVEKLLIPVYPKIRLTFKGIYPIYLGIKEETLSHGFEADLFLTQINPYKRALCMDHLVENKLDVLTAPLPRFIWVIRIHDSGNPLADILYDGTSVFPQTIRTIHFEIGS